MDRIQMQTELESHPKYADYLRWRAEYPHVYQQFKERTLQLMERGKSFGMWLIANVVRWDYYFQYNTEFKISNDFIALLTRELLLEIPTLQAFIKTKKTKRTMATSA